MIFFFLFLSLCFHSSWIASGEIACELAQQKAYQNKWKSVFALCCRRHRRCRLRCTAAISILYSFFLARFCYLNRSARCAATQFYEFSMNLRVGFRVCAKRNPYILFNFSFYSFSFAFTIRMAGELKLNASKKKSEEMVAQSDNRPPARPHIQCKFIRFVFLIYLNRIRNSRSRTGKPYVPRPL